MRRLTIALGTGAAFALLLAVYLHLTWRPAPGATLIMGPLELVSWIVFASGTFLLIMSASHWWTTTRGNQRGPAAVERESLP